MKNRFQFLLFFGAFIFGFQGFAQKSYCNNPITAFVNLSKDSELKETPVEPLKGKMKSIKVEGGEDANIYLVPSSIESDKYLFIFHEWWGLKDYIKSEADQWSEKLLDVNVVALDLYDGKVAETETDATNYMQNAKHDRITDIILAAKNWAGDSAEIANLGWSYGGGWSMQSAILLEENAVGCVMFYGIPESDTTILKTLNCRVLGIFAKKDLWVNKKVVNQYESAMKSLDKEFLTYWYDAVHAFANPSNKHYNKEYTDAANVVVQEYLSAVFSGEKW